ncbi:hypothetical protein [Nostoc sp.]|uniref:hypothetical protein n=1 Tax=Nostoc sp. TaxID=1180 RepID=UPI002FF866EA
MDVSRSGQGFHFGAECYPGQLNQVLINVLVNAIDASDEVNANRTYQEIEANPTQQ